MNNFAPRLGFSWTPGGTGRSAVRGGFGVFYQRTSYTFLTNMFATGARFTTSFTAQFPTNNVDPGPRNGNFPTDPMLVNGPTVNHALIDALIPPGNAGSQHRHGPLRQSRSRELPFRGSTASATSASSGRTSSVSSRLHPLRAAQAVHPQGAQSRHRGNSTLATGTVTRTNPLVGNVGDWAASVVTLVNAGYIDYNTVQVSGTKRYSNGWQGRLSYALSRGRGNTPDGQAVLTQPSQFLGDLRLDTMRTVRPTSTDRTS